MCSNGTEHSRQEPRCRFYTREWPTPGESVVGVVSAVDEDRGAFVRLPEFVGAEGMIGMDEVSRRPLLRSRPLRQLMKVGRQEVLRVLRVDPERGYVDLSKRRVNMVEMESCLERYTQSKVINSILRDTARRLAMRSDAELEDLYSRTAWRFDDSYKCDNAAHSAFVTALSRPEVLDCCDLDPAELKVLRSEIRRRLMPQLLRYRCEFNACCFASEGVDAIRRALAVASERSTDLHRLQIRLLAPPRFLLTLDTDDVLNRDSCLQLISDTLQTVKERLLLEGGEFRLVTKPRLISDRDERELRSLLSKCELANREMSGDEEDGDADERDPVRLSDPLSNDFWTLYTTRDVDEEA